MDEIKYIIESLNSGKMPNDDIGTDLGEYIDALCEDFYIEAQEKRYIDEYGDTDSDKELIIINVVKLEKTEILEALDRFIEISEEGKDYLLSNLKYDDYYFVQYWGGVLNQRTDECYWDDVQHSFEDAKKVALSLIPEGYHFNAQ